jgi:hypothetical protein
MEAERRTISTWRPDASSGIGMKPERGSLHASEPVFTATPTHADNP